MYYPQQTGRQRVTFSGTPLRFVPHRHCHTATQLHSHMSDVKSSEAPQSSFAHTTPHHIYIYILSERAIILDWRKSRLKSKRWLYQQVSRVNYNLSRHWRGQNSKHEITGTSPDASRRISSLFFPRPIVGSTWFKCFFGPGWPCLSSVVFRDHQFVTWKAALMRFVWTHSWLLWLMGHFEHPITLAYISSDSNMNLIRELIQREGGGEERGRRV